MTTKSRTTKEDVRKAINEERMSTDLLHYLEGMGLSTKRLVIELLIGGVWGYTLGAVCNSIVGALMLIGMPAWLQFVTTVFVVVVTVTACFITAGFVASTVYEVGATAIEKTKSLFVSAKEKVSTFEVPSFLKREAEVAVH